MKRCGWLTADPLYESYHDEEWGVPVFDDQKLFEFIVLESAQAGLSWLTILKRREAYREAFCQFEVHKVAKLGSQKVERLMRESTIVRHRAKIESTIENAKAFIRIQKEFESFSNYLWAWVEGRSIQNSWRELRELPSHTACSIALSKDLKKRGFKFLGPTIVYAYMQAVGMVNDHEVGCFRHQELGSSLF